MAKDFEQYVRDGVTKLRGFLCVSSKWEGIFYQFSWICNQDGILIHVHWITNLFEWLSWNSKTVLTLMNLLPLKPVFLHYCTHLIGMLIAWRWAQTHSRTKYEVSKKLDGKKIFIPQSFLIPILFYSKSKWIVWKANLVGFS